MESALLKKSFNLKESLIFGGITTFKDCETATSSGTCTDTRYDTIDDNDKTTETCTDYNCE
ncbi:MAG: hypothetical protein V3U92_14890 [Cellulophaga sp.]